MTAVFFRHFCLLLLDLCFKNHKTLYVRFALSMNAIAWIAWIHGYLFHWIHLKRYLEKRGGHKIQPQLVQVRCQCQRLGASSGFPPAPPEWRCNNCRADPEGCRVARRAVAAYRAGHPKAEATLGAMLQSAIKRGTLPVGNCRCFFPNMW